MFQKLFFQFLLGRTIHQAVEAGDMTRIRALLLSDASLVNLPDATGLTPLHIAAANGNVALVAELLAYHADVNAHDATHGVTPLHLAARNGHHQIAKLLLEHGANPQALDHQGKTPLMLAHEENKRAVIAEFQRHPAHNTQD